MIHSSFPINARLSVSRSISAPVSGSTNFGSPLPSVEHTPGVLSSPTRGAASSPTHASLPAGRVVGGLSSCGVPASAEKGGSIEGDEHASLATTKFNLFTDLIYEICSAAPGVPSGASGFSISGYTRADVPKHRIGCRKVRPLVLGGSERSANVGGFNSAFGTSVTGRRDGQPFSPSRCVRNAVSRETDVGGQSRLDF